MKKSISFILLTTILISVFYCARNEGIKISEKSWIETQLNIEALYFNSLSFPYKVRINSVIIDEDNNVQYELIYSREDFDRIKNKNLEGTITRDIDIFNKFINATIQKYGITFKREFDYQKDIICRIQIWDASSNAHKDIALLENGLFRILQLF